MRIALVIIVFLSNYSFVAASKNNNYSDNCLECGEEKNLCITQRIYRFKNSDYRNKKILYSLLKNIELTTQEKYKLIAHLDKDKSIRGYVLGNRILKMSYTPTISVPEPSDSILNNDLLTLIFSKYIPQKQTFMLMTVNKSFYKIALLALEKMQCDLESILEERIKVLKNECQKYHLYNDDPSPDMISLSKHLIKLDEFYRVLHAIDNPTATLNFLSNSQEKSKAPVR